MNWRMFFANVMSRGGLCCIFIIWLTWYFPIQLAGVIADIVIAGMFIILLIGCRRHRQRSQIDAKTLVVGDADYHELG